MTDSIVTYGNLEYKKIYPVNLVDQIKTELNQFKKALEVMALYPECLEKFKVIVNSKVEENDLSETTQTREPDNVFYIRTS